MMSPPRMYARDVLRWDRAGILHYAETCGLPASASLVTASSSRGGTGKRWTDELKQQMRDMRANGATDIEIGNRFGIPRQRVSQLIGSKVQNRLDEANKKRKG